MEELIISPSNPRIKNIIRLKEKSSERKKQNLLVVEGLREILMAKENNFIIRTLLVCEEINKNKNRMPGKEIPHIIRISRQVFEKIATRENTDGLIALVVPKYFGLTNLSSLTSSCPLFLILEGVEKPGNLGAILRTADGAGADAVMICSQPPADIYNPNVIRASLGCVFSKPVIAASSEEIMQWLRKNKIKVYATSAAAERNYTHTDFTKPCAVALGSEADGLSPQWLSFADEKIAIPMLGKADSLNVSVSAAVILYEALRQRRKGSRIIPTQIANLKKTNNK